MRLIRHCPCSWVNVGCSEALEAGIGHQGIGHSHRYDRVNRILSLGRDRAWRQRALEFLPQGRVLDLGAGTGAANVDLGERTVIAADPSLPMLSRNDSPAHLAAFGERLPLADSVLDGVFSAFVFRNLTSANSNSGGGSLSSETLRYLYSDGAPARRPTNGTKTALPMRWSLCFIFPMGRVRSTITALAPGRRTR